MQEQPDSAPHSQAHSSRADVGHSGPCQQLPHAQKYMLLHVLSQQLEAGQIEHVMQQIKDELGSGFLEQHPDLLFELQRCDTAVPVKVLVLEGSYSLALLLSDFAKGFDASNPGLLPSWHF